MQLCYCLETNIGRNLRIKDKVLHFSDAGNIHEKVIETPYEEYITNHKNVFEITLPTSSEYTINERINLFKSGDLQKYNSSLSDGRLLPYYEHFVMSLVFGESFSCQVNIISWPILTAITMSMGYVYSTDS